MLLLAVLLLTGGPVPPLTPLRVVHPFGPVGRYAAGDRGVDLGGVPGQPVRSALPGTVLFAGLVAGQPVVSVSLPAGRRLTYEPVVAVVRRGQAVTAGTVLGRLAGTHPGCPAPACLHWGLRAADRSYADPLALLGPPRVRLLPLAGPPVPSARRGGAGAVLPPALPAALPAVVPEPAPGPSGRSATPRADGSSTSAGRRSLGAAVRTPAAAAGAVTAVVAAAGMLGTHRRRRGPPAAPPT